MYIFLDRSLYVLFYEHSNYYNIRRGGRVERKKEKNKTKQKRPAFLFFNFFQFLRE